MAESKKTTAQFSNVHIGYKGYVDGSIEFYGDHVEVLTGYSREEFNSKKTKWTDLILEEDVGNSSEIFKQALKTDRAYAREYRIRMKDGNLRWMQEFSQIMCDENGKVQFISGVLMDTNEQKKIEEARLKAERRTGKYLSFLLDGEECGMNIITVKEIIGMMPITTVPRTPEFVKGVINLRGKVIPVVDLRLRFGIEAIDYTDRTCIVVAEIKGTAGTVQIGIVVDAVSEVLNIRGEDIEDTPTFGTKLNTDYILGMAKKEGDVRILFDINRLLSGEEIAVLEKAA